MVEQSIITKNYECEVTQRFVAYRSICRPVNYKAIAPIEDILNEDIEFRREMEGSIRSYFRIFATTSQHMRSFDKYESRLKSIGIKLPESIREKITAILTGDELGQPSLVKRPAPRGRFDFRIEHHVPRYNCAVPLPRIMVLRPGRGARHCRNAR